MAYTQVTDIQLLVAVNNLHHCLDAGSYTDTINLKAIRKDSFVTNFYTMQSTSLDKKCPLESNLTD